MLGTWDKNKKKAIIIGAGISGLMAGYTLKKRGIPFKIYESSPRAGGLIDTHFGENGMVQSGPALTRSNPSFIALCDELGIKLIFAKSKKKYIKKHNKLRSNPLNIGQILKVAFIFITKKRKKNYDTLEEYLNDFFGKKIANTVFTPFFRGIFGVELSELDAEISYPKLFPSINQTLFKRIKEIKKSKPPHKPQIIAPKDGFYSIIDALKEKLKEDIIFSNTCELTESDFEKSNIIVTIPTHKYSTLSFFKDSATLSIAKKVKYSSLKSWTIFFKSETTLNGIGYLSAEKGETVYGCIYQSGAFDHRVKDPSVQCATFISSFDCEKATVIENLDFLLKPKEYELLEIVEKKYTKAIPIYNSDLKKLIDKTDQNLWQNKKSGQLIFSNFSGSASISEMYQMIDLKFSNYYI